MVLAEGKMHTSERCQAQRCASLNRPQHVELQALHSCLYAQDLSVEELAHLHEVLDFRVVPAAQPQHDGEHLRECERILVTINKVRVIDQCYGIHPHVVKILSTAILVEHVLKLVHVNETVAVRVPPRGPLLQHALHCCHLVCLLLDRRDHCNNFHQDADQHIHYGRVGEQDKHKEEHREEEVLRSHIVSGRLEVWEDAP
mmetsp:Transcript_53921/g.140454  ORF Transcript_53921/g.140454 Transcript_53921/m.140454 type:complete len:200 (+) Transcript_53921:3-602(+)